MGRDLWAWSLRNAAALEPLVESDQRPSRPPCGTRDVAQICRFRANFGPARLQGIMDTGNKRERCARRRSRTRSGIRVECRSGCLTDAAPFFGVTKSGMSCRYAKAERIDHRWRRARPRGGGSRLAMSSHLPPRLAPRSLANKWIVSGSDLAPMRQASYRRSDAARPVKSFWRSGCCHVWPRKPAREGL